MDNKIFIGVIAVIVSAAMTILIVSTNPEIGSNEYEYAQALAQQAASASQNVVSTVQGAVSGGTTTPQENLGITESVSVETTGEVATGGGMTGENRIEITSSGFSPNTLTINAGDTVTFVNTMANPAWPASAVHPTHTVYPGSGIEKCSMDVVIFDACRGLAQGESWSFTFNEVGTWYYHNHLNPIQTGSITVQ